MTQITQSGTQTAPKRVDLAYRADGSYDSIGRYSDLAGQNVAAVSAYGYDLAGRLTGLTHARNGVTLAASPGADKGTSLIIIRSVRRLPFPWPIEITSVFRGQSW